MVPSIERRVRDGELRWYVRFRDPPARRRSAQKVKVFNRRVDAERFLTTVVYPGGVRVTETQ